MNEEEQVELLSRVEILKDLPEEEISQVLRDLLRRHAESNLGAGEDFSPPRESDGKLFILKRGRVRVYKMEVSREFILEVLEEGTVFGEIGIPTRYTQEHLGTMIGANMEAVTRAFGRLQDAMGLCRSGVVSSTSMTSKPSKE
jgi:hypothetical protein